MVNPRVLTDTSVIIDFLRKKNKKNSTLWNIRENNECFMSSVTLFELQCGSKTSKHSEDIEKICRWIKTIPFDDDIAEISSIIYQQLKMENRVIEFRDIFIAATAIAENLCIATLNIDHFEIIKDINIVRKAEALF